MRVVFKNYPLSNHKFAKQAAAAALAAERQGKFWEYHDQLFKTYRTLNDKKFVDIAKKLGLNMDEFDRDRRDPEILSRINRDYEEGQQSEVRGIPALFMNGRRVNNRDIGNLQRLVKKQLEKGH